MSLSRTLMRSFPVPRLLVPYGTGVDVSDSSVKWLALTSDTDRPRISSYGNQSFGSGIVTTGAVRDARALAEVLVDVRKRVHISAAHAALPEEGAYVFSMHVPLQSSREQIHTMIEFELENRVPIPSTQAVYDFDSVFTHDDHGEEIAVTVFPRDLAEGYVEAFAQAGSTTLTASITSKKFLHTTSGTSLALSRV